MPDIYHQINAAEVEDQSYADKDDNDKDDNDKDDDEKDDDDKDDDDKDDDELMIKLTLSLLLKSVVIRMVSIITTFAACNARGFDSLKTRHKILISVLKCVVYAICMFDQTMQNACLTKATFSGTTGSSDMRNEITTECCMAGSYLQEIPSSTHK